MRFVKVFINGFLTGMVLQIAVGPVFFLIFGITLSNGISRGLAAISGTVLVDYIFIAIAVSGSCKFMNGEKIGKIFSLAGASIIFFFGISILSHSFYVSETSTDVSMESISHANAFIRSLILTVSNPMTILFWTGLFSIKVAENSYSRKELAVFAVSAGSATFIFLSASMSLLVYLKQFLSVQMISGLNILSGTLLIIYGIKKFISTFGRRLKFSTKSHKQ